MPERAAAEPIVAVLGSLNIDLVVRTPRFPAPGETLLGGPFASFAGGKGLNQAVAAARAGARVRLIGRVGDDVWGAELRNELARAGVDAAAVSTASGEPTGVAVITVDERGENHIVVAPGANARLGPGEVDGAGAALRGAIWLALQLETPLAAIVRAVELARAGGVRTLLNAAPARALPPALLAALDVLVVNESEARSLAPGIAGELDLLRALTALGPAVAVLTRGARGALAWERGAQRAFDQPGFAVEVTDTTAAGDAFVGALVCALACGLELAPALRRAAAAGALACSVHGALPSLPDRLQVDRFLARCERAEP